MHINYLKKNTAILIVSFLILSCASQGPKTFSSALVGKTQAQLVYAKGTPDSIRNFENSKAFIYKTREAYFGKNEKKIALNAKPKKTIEVEYIYYINTEGNVYKYQVWEKKVK